MKWSWISSRRVNWSCVLIMFARIHHGSSNFKLGCVRTMSGYGWQYGADTCCNIRANATLFVFCRQFSVPRCLFRMIGVVVNAFQSAAARCSFREFSSTGLKGSQLLIDAQITWGLGKNRDQGLQSFGRHVVGDKQLRIGHCRAQSLRRRVVVLLLNQWGSRFQFLQQDGAFFRSDQMLRA